MSYLTKYHLSEQNALALLGPVAATLGELERRTLHYAERLELPPADREAVLAASRALAAAHAEIDRIQSAAVQGGSHG
jgi:hypothetical protein